LLAILLIFFGETLSIGAELMGSKRIAAYGTDWSSVFLPMLVLIILGGAMLVAGYMLGYVYFKNIWIVFALSLGSILVVEPRSPDHGGFYRPYLGHTGHPRRSFYLDAPLTMCAISSPALPGGTKTTFLSANAGSLKLNSEPSQENTL
jgi:hypothetical protein